MSSIAPRINSFSPAISSESNTQETSPSAHPAQTTSPEANPLQTPNPAHAGGMPPGQRPGRSEARARRLVLASNRLPDPNNPAAGGLAVALGEMMYKTKGLWIGCSGKTTDEPSPKSVRTVQYGDTTLVQVDLSQQHHDNYYAGFSNSVLWPVFHNKAKHAVLNPAYFEDYKQVNKILASHLAPMLKDDDILWIHDYHLIPLAQELRALNCKQRMGFFNHIPMPSPDDFKKIPQHRELMEALFSYDLVAMQSPRDVKNLTQYVEEEGVGQRLEGARVDAFGKTTCVRDFPIGIDVEKFKALAPSSDSDAILNEVRSESGKGRKLMVGVDRLDYSKGVPTRLKAFRDLLKSHPEMLNTVTFVQVAAPTRGIVPAYAKLSDKTRKLVDDINKEFGTDTWKPVMYFNESVNRNALPEIYRLSRVGVVTPKADGMNLVAKEYIAAQAPEDPGVLVLSTGAGAASQLRETILVPPKNHTALTEALYRGVNMPLEERQTIHTPLMNTVTNKDLNWWRESFLKELSSVPSSSAPDAQRKVTEKAFTPSSDRDDGAPSSSKATSFE